jgi:hypothetical protein
MIDVLERKAPVPDPCDLECSLLLSLIAHVLHADRGLCQDELDLVTPLVSKGTDARAYFRALSRQPLDLDQLAETFPSLADRRDLLELAEYCVWVDGLEDDAEWDLIDRLAHKLGVSRERLPASERPKASALLRAAARRLRPRRFGVG